MAAPENYELFAACAPGLEPLLAREVAALASAPLTEVAGGVEFRGDLATVYRANLELGLALKVLVRLGSFTARKFPALVERTAELPWEAWLAPGAPVRLRVHCQRSRLYHSGAVAERVRLGIARRLGREPADAPPDSDAVAVHARLLRDECTLSLDSSGESLHRRGYRLATANAPLREDLARALIVLSGWDRNSPLVDPFVGSGTIPIEAGLLASGRAPGANRHFAFMDAPGFDRALWERVRAAAEPAEPTPWPVLIGSDRDAGAIEAARANAERARVPVRLERAALGASPLAGETLGPTGALVTNPPYGKRVGHAPALLPLYQSLGKHAAALPDGWRIGLVVADRKLAGATGLALRCALMTDLGGSKVYMLTGQPAH